MIDLDERMVKIAAELERANDNIAHFKKNATPQDYLILRDYISVAYADNIRQLRKIGAFQTAVHYEAERQKW